MFLKLSVNSIFFRRILLSFVSIFLMVFLLPLLANASNVRFNTFGTISSSLLNNDDIIPTNERGQPDTYNGKFSYLVDSLVGLQADSQFGQNFSATLQMVLKDRAEDSFKESIELACVSWKATSNLTFRVGRLGADFYMLSDYRNVGFAYLWQRPPIEFYGPVLLTNFDGADLSYSTSLESGQISIKVFSGYRKKAIIMEQNSKAVDTDSKAIIGVSLNYDTNDWRVHAGYATAKFGKDFSILHPVTSALNNPLVKTIWLQSPHLANEISAKDKRISFYSLGYAYDNNDWLVQAECGYLKSEWAPILSTKSAYLSVGKHIGSYTPYIVLSIVKPDEDAINITPPPEGYGLDELYNYTWSTLNDFIVDQKNCSIGLRKDIGPNMALKIQWDHIWINKDGAQGLFWVNNPEVLRRSKSTVDIVSVGLSWMFTL